MYTCGVTLQYVPRSSSSISHCYKLYGAVQAKQGQAEVFGTELSLGERLALRGQKLAARASSWPCLESCAGWHLQKEQGEQWPRFGMGTGLHLAWRRA